MQAVSLTNGKIQIQTDYPQPKPAANEALIRVTLAGICATDLEIVRGYVPNFAGVLGHEFVGVVEAAPSDAEWVGKRVVGSINIGCGQCAICRRHGPAHCPNRSAVGIHRWDGAFADYVKLPVSNLYEVPDAVPDEAAVFTEPLAAALRIREQVTVSPAAQTSVVGPGRLGLLIGQVLALAGAQVTMAGRSQASLELPSRLGLATALVDQLPGDAFDLVVEATGNDAGFEQALRLVRPLGTLVLKSTFAGKSHLNLTKIVVSEINVVGSRCGPFAPALRLLARQSVDVQSLINAEYPLAEAEVALAHAARRGVRKVLLRPG